MGNPNAITLLRHFFISSCLCDKNFQDFLRMPVPVLSGRFVKGIVGGKTMIVCLTIDEFDQRPTMKKKVT